MDPWPYPLWIAHRGAGKLAPENTLAAFRLGASYDYRAFECDVKLSADGLPFLLHDSSLDRTTSGHGLASNRTWQELSQLDAGGWHSCAFAGEPLPNLADVAGYCLLNDLALNIEIKPSPGDDALTGRAVAAQAASLWAGQALQPLLSSFSPDALLAARAAATQLPRALLLDGLHEGWLKQAQALGCVAVVIQYSLITAEVVTDLHDVGMRVLAYTVNDPAQAQRLIELDIDGLVTDAVDRFAPGAPIHR